MKIIILAALLAILIASRVEAGTPCPISVGSPEAWNKSNLSGCSFLEVSKRDYFEALRKALKEDDNEEAGEPCHQLSLLY